MTSTPLHMEVTQLKVSRDRSWEAACEDLIQQGFTLASTTPEWATFYRVHPDNTALSELQADLAKMEARYLSERGKSRALAEENARLRRELRRIRTPH